MGNINTYPDDETTTDNDRFFTYAADGSTKNTPASNVNKYLGPGWTISGDTLTYSSWNSTTKTGVVNAGSGANTKYQPGMWLKITQPTLGTKYFRITAAATSTVTVKAYDGSVLSNEAITAPFYSAARAPFGASQTGSIEVSDLTIGGSSVSVERTTLTGTSTTITVTVPARKYIEIKAELIGTATSINPVMTFNGSTSGYVYRSSINGGADAQNVSQSSIQCFVFTGATTHTLKADLRNVQTREKRVFLDILTDYANGAASITDRREIVGKWANTADNITTITFTTSSSTFAAGSEVLVTSHD